MMCRKAVHHIIINTVTVTLSLCATNRRFFFCLAKDSRAYQLTVAIVMAELSEQNLLGQLGHNCAQRKDAGMKIGHAVSRATKIYNFQQTFLHILYSDWPGSPSLCPSRSCCLN